MKTVIEMAREAGIEWDLLDTAEGFVWCITDGLERLIEIVRADAIAEEREACAKVCEKLWDLRDDEQARLHANKCAAAIRARGQQ